MICLNCQDKMIIQTNWETVLYPAKQTLICESCQNRLQLLEGKKCEVCNRESTQSICADCERWATIYESDGGDPLQKNVSLFSYNNFIKDIIVRWKYRGDYILGRIFADVFHHYFHHYFNSVAHEASIVPIPLSSARLKERGFNQSFMLASFLTDDIQDVLTRVHSEKQSKRTKKERMSAMNPFKFQSPINKKIILVDDIYTTGRTLRHAATILKRQGCPEVYAYTLIRG